MAEAFNTAIEKLCDKVSPQTDSLIKIAKDVAAGAVLLFVFAAVTVGLIVFLPKIIVFSVENLEKLLEQAPISLKFGALFNI